MMIMIVLYKWDYLLFLPDTTLFQRTNAKLSTELQELKDKMYKLQNERKVEVGLSLMYWPALSVQPILNQVRTLSDKVRTLTVENNVMKDEVKESKAKVSQAMRFSIVFNV